MQHPPAYRWFQLRRIRFASLHVQGKQRTAHSHFHRVIQFIFALPILHLWDGDSLMLSQHRWQNKLWMQIVSERIKQSVLCDFLRCSEIQHISGAALLTLNTKITFRFRTLNKSRNCLQLTCHFEYAKLQTHPRFIHPINIYLSTRSVRFMRP